VGLHMLTLPSHCSHAMQPVDVAIFEPFKGAFCVYHDAWTLQNMGRGVRKEVLASWTSKALQCVLTMENIQAGFHIYPKSCMAMIYSTSCCPFACVKIGAAFLFHDNSVPAK
jgi:hypothetical protein